MISCNEYDYIEIACMYRYPVKLTMKTGKIVEGVAADTQRNDSKQECIELSVNDSVVLVILDEIHRLEVTVENPHFEAVEFV